MSTNAPRVIADYSAWPTPVDAARQLHVSRERVRQLIATGELSVVIVRTKHSRTAYLVSPESIAARIAAIERGEIGPWGRRYLAQRRITCTHGDLDDSSVYRVGRSYCCKACHRELMQAYNDVRREQRRAQVHAYYVKNRERILARAKKRREAAS